MYKEEEEEYAPQPYKYEYGVQDDYTNAAFAKSESQNEVGTVTGSYKVILILIINNHIFISIFRSTFLMVVFRL